MNDKNNNIEDQQPLENIPEESISSEEPIIELPEPQIKEMEVHKHPHHVTHKKKWGEYLLEFSMLFLAVFLGFLAENLREERVEHYREKESMKSMLADIQTDTVSINEVYALGNLIKLKSDTLISMLNNGVNDSNILVVYRLAFETGRVVRAQFENRTSTQLKNSGSMRLIRNNKVADSIRYYWNLIENLEGISSRLEILLVKGADLWVKLFHNKYVAERDANNPLNAPVVIKPGAKLISNDEKLLAEFANLRRSRENVLLVYLLRLKITKTKATGLMNLIKREYHLE